MGRKQTMTEKYKQQMNTYRKKKMKKDNTPYLPTDNNVYVMDTLNPETEIKAEVLKTRKKQHRKIIKEIACPICGNQMKWDKIWEAFICEKHNKKAIYEIVSKKR
jgi:hypothetical protein